MGDYIQSIKNHNPDIHFKNQPRLAKTHFFADNQSQKQMHTNI